MLQFLLIIAVCIGLFYYYCIKPMSYWKNKGVKQNSTVWLLGDSWRNLLNLESFPEMVSRVYNQVPGVRYSGMYQMNLPTLLIRDPELIKQICVKDFEYFVDHRTFIPKNSDPLFSKNLFSLKGQRWREMRPILSPAFTTSKMKGIFVLMSECAETYIKYFLEKNEDLIEVELKDVLTRYTNDVIATTAFGIKTDSLAQPKNEFYMMGKEVSDFSSFSRRMKFFGLLLFPKLFEMLKISLFEKHICKFFMRLIDDTVKTRREKGIIRPDMIHLLMEAQKGIQQNEENIINNEFASVEEADLGYSGKSNLKELTNEDIAAQAMIFFLAGFDVVSTMMCFLAHELAVNVEIQNRLRKEIDKTLTECSGTLSYEALLKMKYMDMVVSETLRKWPGAVVGDRICTKSYTIQPINPDEKPIHIEKGTPIWIPFFGIHRDPTIYPNPERFDPERFSDENKGNINPYAYIPFGVGPRNCIGNRFALLELKVVMFYLLSKFEILPTAKTVIPLRISRKQINLTCDGGFHLAFKKIVK